MTSRPRAGRPLALLQVVLAFAVVLGAIVTACVLNDRVVAAISQARVLVIRANAQSEAVRRLVDSLKDVEIAEQAFLLTGDANALAAYQASRHDLTVAQDRLDQLPPATPELREAVQVLRGLADRQASEAGKVMDVARERGRDAGLDVLKAGSGLTTTARLQDSARQLQHQFVADHEARLAEVRSSERLASRAGVATAAVSAVLLGLAVLVLLRGRARLQHAQRALGAQTDRLAGTVANLRDAIAVFDSTGGLLLWNRQFEGLVRLPEGPLQPGIAMQRIVAVSWPEVPQDLPRHGAPTLHETQVGHGTFEVWRGRMPDGGYILMVADTTRRTRAETIARQATKMEALGQLTGGVAHDFNNLLQVMSANLELLVMRMPSNAVVTDRLAAALGAVDRASQLTRHLLAFARRQPLAPEIIDSARLLTGLEDMLQRTLGEGIHLTFVVGPKLWPIRADQQQLENAILNLAINGRDAMDGQGRLTIEAYNSELDDEQAARMPDIVAGSYVAIAITDTGVGMTAEQLRRALEPFYTTKPEGRGTGLGLPMVFGFAKQSQGHLHLSSEPGHGTTARLYLPRGLAEPQPPHQPAAQPEPARGELVLIVEDDPTVRRTSGQALQSLGYRTMEAADADAALSLISNGLRPDLLFTDVVMPGRLDAPTLAAQARQLIPDLAVVFTSGYAETILTADGCLDPDVTLVGKPWKTGDLAGRLRQALHKVRSTGGPPLHVVLAEDDELIRQAAAELLTELGHTVIEVSTGGEALEAIDAACDLLITDLGLPDMDGIQLADLACATRPTLAVVVASGRSADPASGYVWLQKPYNAAGLRAAVARSTERLATPSG